MIEQTLTVASTVYSVTGAFEKVRRYPWKTPFAFDLQGAGTQGVLTLEEVVRTRKVSSRVSNAQAVLFIDAAGTAPWVDAAADLADADPQETGGLFDAMTNLYWHFGKRMPKGVSIAKISKVLYLKNPALYPILDTHLMMAYAPQIRDLRKAYPQLGRRRRAWIAIREELLEARSTGAIEELRQRLRGFDSANSDETARVRRLGELTDLRLLDILVW